MRDTLGHYEVLRPIGAGGMGEVFVARDPKLGRKVAIKLLPSRLAAETDTLNRFTQEARSASALNHPNIVTIHEVGADDGAPFIVMEYIDGRDLRTLISDGPVPVRQVLDVAVQIADGLAAAHERGIVHRDLKPENIMITRDGYVKILDFGLAKVVGPTPEGEHTLQLDIPGTMPGTILGTVGYMSPEQATGKRIDFRSDLFAFGAILHELVTARPAFDGENAIDTLSAILHHDPQPVMRVNPRAPVQLSDIISRLLSKSADDRYSSTRDLARELRLLRDRVAAEESGFHQPLPEPRRPAGIIVGAIALLVFLAGAAYLAWERSARTATTTTAPAVTATPAPKKYLAVLRFTDRSGDPNGQLVVDGFAETLTARLAHFPNVQVMRPPTSDPGPTDPRKAANDLGANLVLSGSMMREGDRIRVTYAVLEPKTGREWHDMVEGRGSNLFGVQDDVAASVARNLDLGTTTVRPALDPAVSQHRYLEALGHLRRYDDAASVNNAIRILESLGDSPSVQAALARAYLYKYQDTREPQYASSASRAAESALAADPQSLDVNVTLGELRRATGRHKEAVEAFLRVLSQQPNNAEAVLGLAETYKAANDFKNAETQYRRAIALQPNYWSPYNKLGAFYYSRGRFADAIPQFQRVVELVPDNEFGYNNLGGMFQLLGRNDEAAAVYRRSITRKPTSQGYSNLGTCLYATGRYADAAAAFDQAVKLTPTSFLYWRNLGDALRWVPGREAEARRAFSRAIELCDEEISVNSSNALAHAARASALAKIGRVREGRTGILRALELAPSDPTYVYEAAVIANIAGTEDEAIARLEQAIRLGLTVASVENDPEFANLRKSGRLQAIVQSQRSSDSTH
jgi:tetratricopeptide (TPR) repeat protein/TolB-like protein/predicted Ser/Thr protein kinase